MSSAYTCLPSALLRRVSGRDAAFSRPQGRAGGCAPLAPGASFKPRARFPAPSHPQGSKCCPEPRPRKAPASPARVGHPALQTLGLPGQGHAARLRPPLRGPARGDTAGLRKRTCSGNVAARLPT